MRQNAKFNDKLRQTWLWFMQAEYPGLIDDIDSYVAHISEAAKADRRRWHNQPVPDGGQEVADNSDMSRRRNKAVDHLTAKINWLKEQWGDYTTGSHPEPTRDATPAAPLPEYAQSGIDEILAEDAASDIPAVYYDLQGNRVTTLTPGTTYIRVCGDKATKLHITH